MLIIWPYMQSMLILGNFPGLNLAYLRINKFTVHYLITRRSYVSVITIIIKYTMTSKKVM